MPCAVLWYVWWCRFSVSSSVDVAAVRFFKGRFEPGTRHSAKIYDSLTGSLLATTGNFTDLVHTPI